MGSKYKNIYFSGQRIYVKYLEFSYNKCATCALKIYQLLQKCLKGYINIYIWLRAFHIGQKCSSRMSNPYFTLKEKFLWERKFTNFSVLGRKRKIELPLTIFQNPSHNWWFDMQQYRKLGFFNQNYHDLSFLLVITQMKAIDLFVYSTKVL